MPISWKLACISKVIERKIIIQFELQPASQFCESDPAHFLLADVPQRGQWIFGDFSAYHIFDDHSLRLEDTLNFFGCNEHFPNVGISGHKTCEREFLQSENKRYPALERTVDRIEEKKTAGHQYASSLSNYVFPIPNMLQYITTTNNIKPVFLKRQTGPR